MIITYTCITIVNVWKKKAKAAFLWFHMRNLSLAGYNCSGGASCMACSFIFLCICRSILLCACIKRCHNCRSCSNCFQHLNVCMISKEKMLGTVPGHFILKVKTTIYEYIITIVYASGSIEIYMLVLFFIQSVRKMIQRTIFICDTLN